MTRPAASKVVLQHLRYVLAAAEKRSFRQAAIALDLQESIISRGIRVFEDEIGFTLFERSHAGVRLTEAGKHYLRDVRAVLRYLDRATAEAQSIASGQQGRLRLAVSEDVMTLTLAHVLTAHRARWPGVSVDLVEMLRPDQFHALQSGLVDLGLMLQPLEEGNFSADPLWTEGCMVALPEAHPLTTKSELQANDLGDKRVIVEGSAIAGFYTIVLSLTCSMAWES
jgi:DNA-binding transcriptional LysR family regulator